VTMNAAMTATAAVASFARTILASCACGKCVNYDSEDNFAITRSVTAAEVNASDLK